MSHNDNVLIIYLSKDMTTSAARFLSRRHQSHARISLNCAAVLVLLAFSFEICDFGFIVIVKKTLRLDEVFFCYKSLFLPSFYRNTIMTIGIPLISAGSAHPDL